MKKEFSTQLVVALAIFVIGGILIGGEYLLVKWMPRHKQQVTEETMRMLPYHNDALGLDMQVAAGIYGKVESFLGGVKISRSRFWGTGPSLTITSEPNVDHAAEFSPQILAKWETDGDYLHLVRYRYDHTQIEGRAAVLIQQLKNHAMLTTAHVMSPDRVIVAECSTASDEGSRALLMVACDETLHTIKIAGPATNTPPKLEDVPAPTFTPPRITSRH